MTTKILLALREATSRLIAENPVGVVIHRVEYVDDGTGGRVKVESNLPQFSGRLVPSRQVTVQFMRDEAGGLQTAAWLLIAPWTADLKASSDVQDTFRYAERTYRVSRVIRRTYLGEITGIHAVVEEVA